jgi:hypothetical protein
MLFSSHRLIKVLEVFVVAAILLAITRPQWGSGFYSRLAGDFRDFARDRRRAILAAALFPMIARLLMLPWFPPPTPAIHDEFSYLLQADTFAHGRVANPTPPYWQHFESEYVLLQPTYASQYQPAQGLALALGQVAMRNAWWGVWLSVGVMFGAIWWALTFVMPNAWALAASMGAGLQFGIFGLWMNSYFGGAVAATAGALIMGALARMPERRKQRSSAALCAFGVVILFASRPFEAIIWSVVSLAFLEFHLRKRLAADGVPESRFRLYSRLLPSFLVVFLAGASALAWYNWRITGDPLNPPYLEYQRIYGTPQPYWWGKPLHITSFSYPEIRDNYLNQLHLYDDHYSLWSTFDSERRRLRDFWRFFVGPFFTPGLIFIGYIFRDRRIRPWLWASIPFVVDKATYHAWFPAQNAPATVLIVLVMAQCWRHLHAAWRTRRMGAMICNQLAAAFVICVALGGIGRAVEPILPGTLRHLPPLWESLYPRGRLRDNVTAILEKTPGKHLVFVKYSADHCFCEEWVFNGADIRNQRIVYARPYTPESDAALARYLDDHDVWVIEPDEQPYRLARTDDSYLAKILRSDDNGE